MSLLSFLTPLSDSKVEPLSWLPDEPAPPSIPTEERILLIFPLNPILR